VTIAVEPIGFVTSDRDEAIDDAWDSVTSSITLVPPYTEDALRGLDTFSHIEVVFVFDRVDPESVTTGARHPRGNPDWPEVGIFAQRAKDRPNRIGVSVCAIERIDGTTIEVRGLDAIAGTPVLDIKPYMQEFAPRGAVRQPAWSHELMAQYFD
jgi:tRNA-Thr(GGU) m(6)t(6)A37 methyltransferase TsaA